MDEQSDATVFGIGRLSKQSGVKVETIRYYEKIGLLAEPPRSASGYRRYGEAHLAQLRFIRRARELGFPLADIRALLTLAHGEHPCADVQRIAQQQLAQLSERIRDMQRLYETLAAVERDCQRGQVGPCPVLETLWKG